MKCAIRHSIFLLVLGVLAACEPIGTCRKDLRTYMQVTLSADSLDQWLNTHHYTTWDTLSVKGVGRDSMIVSHKNIVANFQAELQPNDSVTAFEMTYHGQTDTLYVLHTPRLQFESLACGCAVYHTLLGAWSTDERVDSVVVMNAAVETTVQENLRIYLRE